MAIYMYVSLRTQNSYKIHYDIISLLDGHIHVCLTPYTELI